MLSTMAYLPGFVRTSCVINTEAHSRDESQDWVNDTNFWCLVLIHDLTICWDLIIDTASVFRASDSPYSRPYHPSSGVKFPVTCDSSPRCALTAAPQTRGNHIKHFGPMMAALLGLLRGINVTDIGAVNLISTNTCQLGPSFI